MKVARFVLKVVALSLTTAAVVCAIIAYWDKLTELGQNLFGKLQEKKACICKSEYDDYVE
ncbi:MAG: hypothetical protein J6A62_02620 [Oscillospiraceae bacterium]|nr:hypothetical protein [Oscillospiraceae bacterium]